MARLPASAWPRAASAPRAWASGDSPHGCRPRLSWTSKMTGFSLGSFWCRAVLSKKEPHNKFLLLFFSKRQVAAMKSLGVDANHYFQASFVLKTSCFPRGSDGFLERRIPGKNGDVTPRKTTKQRRVLSKTAGHCDEVSQPRVISHSAQQVTTNTLRMSEISPRFLQRTNVPSNDMKSGSQSSWPSSIPEHAPPGGHKQREPFVGA